MFQRILPAASAALLLFTSHSTADELVIPIYYSSAPFPQLESSAVSSVSVITRDEIEASGASDLTSILTRKAGVNVVKSGGRAGDSKLFLRGANEDQILVLLNGVRLGSASTGEFNLSRIPPELVERIEIIKGPQAALYGPDAVGGVISVFTRTQGDNQVSAKIGNRGMRGTTLLLNEQTGPWAVSVAGSTYRTDGFDVRSDKNSDDDGVRQKSIDLSLAHGSIDEGRFHGRILQSHADAEYDGFSTSSYYINERFDSTLTTGYSKRLNESQRLKIEASRVEDESRPFKNGVPDNNYQTTRNSVTGFFEHKFDNHWTSTFGLDWEDDQLASNLEFPTKARENLGSLVSISHQTDQTNIESTVRYDENDQFGSATSYTVGVSAGANDWTYGARRSKAINTPSLSELYFPTNSMWLPVGNPNLGVETARTTEIWARYSTYRLDYNTSVFQSGVHDVIEYDGGTYVQDRNAEIFGVEQSLTYTGDQATLAATVTYLDATDQTGVELPNRPELTASLAGEVQISGGVRLSGSVTGVKRQSTGRSTGVLEVPGYMLADAKISKTLTSDVSVSVAIDNLFDKEGFNRQVASSSGAYFPFAPRTTTFELTYTF